MCYSVCFLCFLCSQYRGGVCRRPAVCHPLPAGEDGNPQLVSTAGGFTVTSDPRGLFRGKQQRSRSVISGVCKRPVVSLPF